MSTGPGVAMRGVLAHTTAEWLRLNDLAYYVFEDGPTRAHVESVRRAAKRLAEQGLVEIGYVQVQNSRWGGLAWDERVVPHHSTNKAHTMVIRKRTPP